MAVNAIQQFSLLFLVSTLCTFTPLSAQSAANISVVGRWTEGSCFVIAADSTLAYIGSHDTLNLVDIRIHASPALVGQLVTPSNIYGLLPASDYLYVADSDSGLRIIDVSNPSYPVEVGFLDTDGRAYDVDVRDSSAYLADEEAGLRIINISNPSSPVELGAFDLDIQDWIRAVEVENIYAYIAGGSDMHGVLRVLDINDPGSPTEVHSYGHDGVCVDVIISGQYLYTIFGGASGILIFDISNPASPVNVGVVSGDITGMHVDGTTVYAISGNDGWLKIFDASDPAYPVEKGQFTLDGIPYPGWAHDIHVSGDYTYLAAGDSGLYILEYDPTAITIAPGPILPSSFTLQQNYPNPFNPTTAIRYTLPAAQPVLLKVYDLLGREVATLVDGNLPAGEHKVTFDSGNLPSGIYLYRLAAGRYVQTRKMLLLK